MSMLPGVGAFGAAMARLVRARARSARLRERIVAGRPTMAICVGHQLLFETSDESPGVRGLGVVPGSCRPVPGDVRVPQFGWNRVQPSRDRPDRGRLRLFREQLPGDRGARLGVAHGRARRALSSAAWSGATSSPASSTPSCRAPMARRCCRAGWSAADARRRGSSPASTSATAGWSRACASRACATPAIRPSGRGSIRTRGRRDRHPGRLGDARGQGPPARDRPAGARGAVDPAHRRRRRARGRGRLALLEAGADKVSVNTAAVDRPELLTGIAERFGRQCCVIAIDAAQRDGKLRGAGQGRARGHRHRRDRVGARGRAARGRRGPADLLGPGWHPLGLRSGADRCGGRTRCTCR